MKNSICALLAVAALTAATSINAQAVKWHPGHYLELNAGGTQTEHFRHIDEISREPAIKGVKLRLWWYELETAKGSYNYSKIDAYLNKLKSLPTRKYLVVRIMDRRFGTSSTARIVPGYLLSESAYNGGVVRQKGNVPGYVARLWEAPVMDRLIALYQALGTRYDADSHLEGFATAETVLTLGAKSEWPSGYSLDALLKQYMRFTASARKNLQRTNLFLGANYLGSDQQMGTLIQSLFDAQMGISGPGVLPGKPTQAQRIWSGQTGADYRGGLAIGSAIEALALGGSKGDFTPKQIYDFAYNTLRVDHLFWVRNTWTGDASQRWNTGILPFLRTNPPTRTACPLSYGLCTSN